MSCKAGNQAHKQGCQKYKQENRRDKNKAIRAERNERRIAKFAKRRAEKGEIRKDYLPKNPDERGENRMAPLGDFAWRPKMEHMTAYQKERSFMRRIQNQLDAEILAEKKAEQAKNNTKNK